jgi:RHS repeat-associated protein
MINRGYTGHEHLDKFGIINMNGRVYDPLTAQFLSPDPYIQAPGNWLNYNRYSYCLNNPFKYTDPDGEWIWIVVGAVIGGVINVAIHWDQIGNFGQGLAAFGIGAAGGALAAATGGAALGAFGTAAGAGGFIGGAVAGGVGYTFGIATTSIGNNIAFGDPMPTAGQFASGLGIAMLTGGTVNGIVSAANGGNFFTGPKAVQPTVPQPTQPAQNTGAQQGQTQQQQAQGQGQTTIQSANPEEGLYTLNNKPQPIKLTGDGIKLPSDPSWRDPNFRANLIEASGIDPGKTAQAHHLFPLKYGKQFLDAGVDPNRYGAWWSTASHSANSAAYNQSWGTFFQQVSSPSKLQLYNEMLRLRIIFGY